MINAGELNRRIVLQRATEVIDNFGNSVLTWAPLATVWAKATFLQDSEVFRAQQVQSGAKIRFLIRWGKYVKETDRITFQGKTYDVIGAKDVGFNEGQELTVAAEIN